MRSEGATYRPVFEGDMQNGNFVRRALGLCAVAAVACAAVLLYFVAPEGAPFMPKCILNHFTGLYCPGCGGLRAMHALFHGRIIEAMSYNVFAVLVVVPLGSYTLLREAVYSITGKKVKGIEFNTCMATILLWAVIVFTILRNLPFAPFNILAP